MRRVMLLAIVSLFLSVSANAQEKLSFERVIKADSVPKQQIYNGIKVWLATEFVSSKAVLEVDDKDAGIILAKPVGM